MKCHAGIVYLTGRFLPVRLPAAAYAQLATGLSACSRAGMAATGQRTVIAVKWGSVK